MCNLYSITTNQAAIIALFRVINRYVGNLAPMPGVFPDYPAPVVRNTDTGGELSIMRWGMPPPPRSLRLSRRSHSAALPPTTTPHFPLAHECPNRDAQSRSARHHHPDSAPPQSWIGRRFFRQCLKDTGRAFCWGGAGNSPMGSGRAYGELRAFALLPGPVPNPGLTHCGLCGLRWSIQGHLRAAAQTIPPANASTGS
jgi:hypothetical protein